MSELLLEAGQSPAEAPACMHMKHTTAEGDLQDSNPAIGSTADACPALTCITTLPALKAGSLQLCKVADIARKHLQRKRYTQHTQGISISPDRWINKHSNVACSAW